MTGTLVTRRLSPKTMFLIVDPISGRNAAKGSRITTAIAHANAIALPVADRRASNRSHRWHSAVPPAGRSGMACVAPQSAQVTVTLNHGGRCKRSACRCWTLLQPIPTELPAHRRVTGELAGGEISL